jgi:hypothetical protein
MVLIWLGLTWLDWSGDDLLYFMNDIHSRGHNTLYYERKLKLKLTH